MVFLQLVKNYWGEKWEEEKYGTEIRCSLEHLHEVQATIPDGSYSARLHYPVFHHWSFLQPWNESLCLYNLPSYRCWHRDVPFCLFPWKVHTLISMFSPENFLFSYATNAQLLILSFFCRKIRPKLTFALFVEIFILSLFG